MFTTVFLRAVTVIVKRRTAVRRNFEIEIRHHGAHLHRRPGQKAHTGRVVPHGRQIVAHNTGAGIRAAETRHGLFGQHEAARNGRRRQSGGKRRSCRQFQREVFHSVLHRMSLSSHLKILQRLTSSHRFSPRGPFFYLRLKKKAARFLLFIRAALCTLRLKTTVGSFPLYPGKR